MPHCKIPPHCKDFGERSTELTPKSQTSASSDFGEISRVVAPSAVTHSNGGVAQLEERGIVNAEVTGPNPAAPALEAAWQRGGIRQTRGVQNAVAARPSGFDPLRCH